MKKFISVILAIMMVVSVMPFVLFAAEEEGYKEPANQAHICHPTKDGKLDLTDLDMKALYEAGDVTITFKDGKADENKAEYLVDGMADTATRLTAGSTVITVETKNKTLVDLATLTLVVNGKGTINGGSTYADKVTVDTKHNLKVNVVVYGLDKDGKDVVVYTSDKDIDTTDLTELVLDVFEPGYKVVITTAGAAEAGKGARRLWELDATVVKGEETYVHTWVNTITKYPALGVEGEYTQKCAKCGYDNPEKQVIPALTKDTLTGGYITADDVESIVETHTLFKEDGKTVVTDDDGNEISYEKHPSSNPNAVIDGIKTHTSCYDSSGNFWTGLPGSFLTITFKNEVTVSAISYDIWTGWAAMKFEFYKGETLVGVSEYWYWAGGTVDITGTVELNDEPVDVAAGFTFDKIVCSPVGTAYGNYREFRLSELNLFTHTHVYDDSLIESANGVRADGKTCEYNFADASKVVCRECGAAAGKANEKVTLTIHDYPETVVDGKVVLDESKASVTAPTCGKDGKLEYTCSHEYVDETSPVYARFTKKVDGKDVPVYGKNNQQLYLGKDGKGYDGTEITDWSTIVVTGYNKKTCGDKLVVDIPATNEHKGTTTTVRIGKYPNCGATGTAYVICTDCKQRVEIATAADLVKYGLATDADALKGTNLDKSFTDEATGKAYTVRFAVDGDGKVTSIAALTTGYHRTAYKNVVASTYTAHGIDCAYCTVCGTTFAENTKDAELVVPVAKLRTLGFSLRTAEFEGLRGTFTLNNDVIKGMQANGYNVRIWVVVTNEAGVSKEIQIYGAGSNAWVALDGKFSVVVKGGTADEVYTFSYKIVVEDDYGTAENVVELGKSSVAEVKAAQ